MNMPTFTADIAADAEASRSYTARFARHDQNHSLHLAQRPPDRCYSACLLNCQDLPYYCRVNCRCECYGIPGKNCWFQ
jgi:hypothetical protein